MKNKKLASIVIWSVISAAFIGPGTITTAASAGSTFKLDLLWTVVFATLACFVLQEIAARVVIAGGKNLGQALLQKFGFRKGKRLQLFLGGSVILGCAAYEAGNILGAVSGLKLLIDVDSRWLTLIVFSLASLLLWSGQKRWIFGIMMTLVAVMGVAFFVLAFATSFSPSQIAAHAVTPLMPSGSALLTLGLVGTTIVPYNIFVGSGISENQTLPLMRTGLSISIAIGGLITAAILVAGTQVQSFTTFDSLSSAFAEKLGVAGPLALALGLFAAGFSSTVTAPFAASLIVSTVIEPGNAKWPKGVALAVLFTGLVFGISGVKPVPVILIVQAINGFILPMLVVFLVMMINDKTIVPGSAQPGVVYNLIILVILEVILILSISNVLKVAANFVTIDGTVGWTIIGIVSLGVVLLTALTINKTRRQSLS